MLAIEVVDGSYILPYVLGGLLQSAATFLMQQKDSNCGRALYTHRQDDASSYGALI